MTVNLFSIYFIVFAWLIPSGFPTPQQENKTQTQSDDEQVPSWAMREYNYPPSLVYPAALQSIQIQKHEVQAKNPPGADVELDGKFVGNTPTTLHVKPGDYTVVVKKEGFQPWSRKVAALSANELRIAAELKKE